MDNNMSVINVAVRIRPLLQQEFTNVLNCINKDGEPPVLVVSNRGNNAYAFDHIFTYETQQHEIYNVMLKPLLARVLDGYNCVILAYGQTGTGKTYTMGTDYKEGINDADPGLIPRVLEDLFIASSCDLNLKISISFIEIYNEKVYDLLTPSKTHLLVKGFTIKNMTCVSIEQIQEAKHWLLVGGKNRHVRQMKQNSSSSRSHAVFTVYCTKNDVTSKLHLVDLAGSESAGRTGNIGTPLREGTSINKGLLALGRVISALADPKAALIPYRGNILTTILRDSLNRDNYISLLACVSPTSSDIAETLHTLRFADKAKSLISKPQLETIVSEFDRNNPGILPSFTPISTVKKKKKHRPNMFTSTSIKQPTATINQMLESPTYCSTMNSLLSASSSTVLDLDTSRSQSDNLSPLIRAFNEIELRHQQKIIDDTTRNKENEFQNTLNNSNMQDIQELKQFLINYSHSKAKLFNKLNQFQNLRFSKRLDFDSPILKSSNKSLTPKNEITFKVPNTPKYFKPNKTNSVAVGTSPIVAAPRRSTRLSLIRSNRQSCNESFGMPIPAPRSIAMPKPKRVQELQKISSPLKSIRRSMRLSTRLINNFAEKNIPTPAPRQFLYPLNYSVSTNKKKMVQTKLFVSPELGSPKTEHKSNILRVLNFGNQKDIQGIATIGTKTATQILTYRKFNGKFKTFDDLKNVPTWTEKKFERFMLSNLLY